MKILHIASGDFFSTYGGGQVYVKNIVDEMIRLGEDVSVISFAGNSGGIRQKDYSGIPLYEVGTVWSEDVGRLIAEIRPDIIHAHSQKARVCEMGRRLGIPVVVTAHHGGIVCPAGTLLDCDDAICHRPVTVRNCTKCYLRNIRTGLCWYPLVRHLSEKVYVRLGRWLSGKPFVLVISPVGGAAWAIVNKAKEWNTIAEQCTLMIAPSYVMGEAMTSRGLDPAKLKVVPHGTPEPKEIAPYPSVDGRLKFFYVGRICYVKGIHILLEAFHGIENPDIELHLIGEGGKKTTAYMASLQKKYASDSRVVWHGKVPPAEVYGTIRGYHVSSSSSSSYLESFGLNIAESLAMGKPVLATRCGGAEMQIEEGVNGWLVPTNNAAALRAKMEEIIRDKAALPAMSDACRRSVIPLRTHCEELLGIYGGIVKK